jgi:hypothetical protein
MQHAFPLDGRPICTIVRSEMRYLRTRTFKYWYMTPSDTGRTYARFQYPMMLRAGAVSVASMKSIVLQNSMILISLEIDSDLRTGPEASRHQRK